MFLQKGMYGADEMKNRAAAKRKIQFTRLTAALLNFSLT